MSLTLRAAPNRPRGNKWESRMRSIILSILIANFAVAGCSSSGEDGEDGEDGENPIAIIKTNKGELSIRLLADKAPIAVENFKKYAADGFYDDTVFHRVIPGFMIQGGGYTKDLTKKKVGKPIKNEADNGLSNKKHTVAMARTKSIDSATSQFFINLVDNGRLDHKGTKPHQFGYTVFAELVEGEETIETIVKSKVPCPTKDPKSGRKFRSPCKEKYPAGMRDVPKPLVIIESITID